MAGMLTAVALAALTLAVFAQNQLTGPEGALTRFFIAVKQRDRNRVLNAIEGNPTNIAMLAGLADRASGFDVADIQRKNGTATATVLLAFRDGTVQPSYWRLTRVGNAWRIDADATLHPFKMTTGEHPS
jgi:hypothetical protein